MNESLFIMVSQKQNVFQFFTEVINETRVRGMYLSVQLYACHFLSSFPRKLVTCSCWVLGHYKHLNLNLYKFLAY